MSLIKREARAHCPMCAMLSHLSHVRLFVTLRIAAHQAPLSTGFFRQEYWSGSSRAPDPRESSQPRDRTQVSRLLHWQAGSLPLGPPWTPSNPNLTTHFHSLQQIQFMCLVLGYFFVCFKTLIFFYIFLTPHVDSQSIKCFEYAQTLIVGKLKFILTGLLKFTIVVCIFMFPVWDYHFTIVTRFFQYLVCMEKKDPRG